jgi:hypothetical protein
MSVAHLDFGAALFAVDDFCAESTYGLKANWFAASRGDFPRRIQWA